VELSAGTFEQPILTENGTKCSGVRTADGTEYYADKVILAAGAWSPALVDLEGQCVSKVSIAYTVDMKGHCH
jgi:sarcosine oxidase/L-pipecolate oxidase